MTNFEGLIGHTRLLRLARLPADAGVPDEVSLLAKMEGEGPGGSVKDRPAWSMLTEALRRGELTASDPLVEATSGNTGIALAMAAGRLGLAITLVVPYRATIERVQAMRAYGARIVRTAECETIEDARTMAQEMARTGRYRLIDQFNNPDNPAAHYRTTGPEIWNATDGAITHFVSAMGTTGTIMGVSRFLKEQSASVQVVGTQPAEGSRIPGIRRWSPEMIPGIFEPDRVDRIIEVNESQARTGARDLARSEGVLAGMSTGGALAAALEVAAEIQSGTVVFVACDRGDRYLSSDLYESSDTHDDGTPGTIRTEV